MKVVICTRDSTKVPKGFSISEEASKYLIFSIAGRGLGVDCCWSCKGQGKYWKGLVGGREGNHKLADRGGGLEMGSQSALQVYLDPKENPSNCPGVYASKVSRGCRLGSTRKSTYLDPKEKSSKSPVLFLRQRSGSVVHMYLGPRKGKFVKF